MLLLMSAFITFDTYEANLIFKLNLYTIKKTLIIKTPNIFYNKITCHNYWHPSI